jgi:hypothetical protein
MAAGVLKAIEMRDEATYIGPQSVSHEQRS